MGASLYIVVEGEDPGFDIFVHGQAMARNQDSLDTLAQSLKITPLLDFFSADKNSMALLLEACMGEAAWEEELPPPQWFRPQDGLNTVRSLLSYLRETPYELGGDTRFVVHELEEYERVLHKTEQRDLRWQLAVSWM